MTRSMHTASAKVSVILPFYNAELTLERAIGSIDKQDLEDFECILVDNNSTDGSRRIAEQWVEKDSRFKLISEAQQGVMFASNRGAKEGRANYLARMDADDVALPERLRLQADFLDQNPDYGAVAGRVLHVGDTNTTEGFRRFVEWSNSLCSYEEIYFRRFIEAPIVNPTAMWRRSTMDQHGMYLAGDFPEDYEMWLRWLDQGVKMAKLKEIVLEWHDSEHRLTRLDPIYSDRSFYEVKSRYLAKWLAENNRFHPQVAVWGASRISRRRARIVEEHGIAISSYIDTKKGRQIERDVTYYEELPHAGDLFILTYIRQMDNREKIQTFLEERGYEEGIDYLLVS
ncbi:MAG: glycosyltransferase family 2 protein [Bacteroidia bacterium]|nr:MAG: glycosyltransferase family 2 protein [Bacteroidia bacterium]